MGYIEETLGQSESLIYKARFHWLHYALALFELLLILMLAVWGGFFVSNLWLKYLLLLGCAGALLLLFRSVLPLLTTEIGVTSQRLIVKRGWVGRSTDEIPLRAIEQVNFQQGLIGRLLGFGQVDVHGTGVDNLIIPPIADPLRLVKAIEDAKGDSKTRNSGS